MYNLNINGLLMDLHKKNFMKNLWKFSAGAALSAFAFTLFYQKENIVIGGGNGLSILLSNFLPVDVSLIILVVNLICLMIGLIFFGWDYAVKMLAITFIYPVFVRGTVYLANAIDLEDTSLFLKMVIAGGLTGFANGLIRNSGYSPGGFYSLYDVLHKYLHVSIGTANNLINVVIISLGGFFFGIEKAIYAIISLLTSSYMVDKVTIGISDNKVFYIVTDKPLEVQEYVNDRLNYDITIINARGGYTNKKKKMLMSVISTHDYVSLKELVRGIDPKAFFLIVDAYESSVRKKYVKLSKSI
ncbi:MAG: YitT family protein [Bacilli bacterium]|nr:YitT family protein [Bacilli bacterium]